MSYIRESPTTMDQPQASFAIRVQPHSHPSVMEGYNNKIRAKDAARHNWPCWEIFAFL